MAEKPRLLVYKQNHYVALQKNRCFDTQHAEEVRPNWCRKLAKKIMLLLVSFGGDLSEAPREKSHPKKIWHPQAIKFYRAINLKRHIIFPPLSRYIVDRRFIAATKLFSPGVIYFTAKTLRVTQYQISLQTSEYKKCL